MTFDEFITEAKSAAWQRKEGKNKSGGLNEKGRKSYERENPGSDLKAPQPEGGPRKRSFCARMGGVKGPMKKPNGEPTRKALALRKWKCYMKKDFGSIDKALNTNSIDVEVTATPEVKPELPTRDVSKELDKDYEYTRGNLYSLIEKGQETLNGIMELADETQSPRAFEVAGQVLKSVADTTDKLLDLQKKLKDIDETKSSATTNVTNNAMFVGSTAELQKMLKEMGNSK